MPFRSSDDRQTAAALKSNFLLSLGADVPLCLCCQICGRCYRLTYKGNHEQGLGPLSEFHTAALSILQVTLFDRVRSNDLMGGLRQFEGQN